MKKWIGLAAVAALIISSAMVVWATEQEDKSGSTGMSHSSETKGKRLTGQLVHIEGWHYTVKDNTGQEVSFGVTALTKLLSSVKEGGYVVAMIGDDNIATSLKNLKKSSKPAQ
jgi:hypothetical protein